MSLPTDEIFIQIAAYRDPDLEQTVADCLAKAADPDRLTFGICWQHGPDEAIDAILEDPRMRVIAVPHNRSRGVCWARSQLQQLYDGEEYTLQLDSHHRFVEGWDQALVEMLEGLRAAGSERPLLTSYAPHFDPADDESELPVEPLRLVFDHFIPDGSVFIRPEVIPDHEDLEGPLPARFYSAHFAFTLGSFVSDVPHDPELYFTGEEPIISVRAFTQGYDLFHPHRVLLWHHYTRPGEPRHWEDDPKWAALNALSYRRQRQLLGMEPGGPEPGSEPLALGTVRSLEEYESFSGIDFENRKVQQQTAEGIDPPNAPPSPENPWVDQVAFRRTVTITVSPDEIPVDDDVDFWFVGAHDTNGDELFREDLTGDQLAAFVATAPHTRSYTFEAPNEPVSWTVWPHSETAGWLTKVTRSVESVGEPADEGSWE